MNATTSNDPVSFPTSASMSGSSGAGGSSGSGTEYRDATVTRTAMQAHAAVDKVADSIGPVVDRVKDVAARASERLRFGDRGMEDMQDEVLNALRQTVRKNPVAAVSIALALGWMIGRSR
ncbi:hypothetical protein [Piscinibacter koreensis]|uniref:DUF883 domain-containing protein n=1 Tax=Piscinibacter koreensis TaxID=2742824 RepID=A0A7Y6NLV4_9BURK|nr:hypothetical protein [Schlegelella koreensis]NUZ05565.1 hypothetical protein [Schlegelella koreensis]